uniref:Uncharacterized protein n=1 Tax=Tanacetum cinerariifolium TaxID=118510 RepID=A0A699GMI9_TANCI|nr:hypothetical protein [Tanacetum cinerariifolium]
MSRDVLTVGSIMRIPLLYQGEYSQWSERFINYRKEQPDREAMINSITNGDQPLPRFTHVSIAGTSSTEQPPLKDKSMWSDQEKKIQKIDHLWKQYATMMRQNKNLLDINIDALYNILKQNQGDVNDAMKCKKEVVVITSDPLALVAEQTKVSKRKEKFVISSESDGSDDELKKITALLAKAFNRKKLYSKPANNNLRTSSATSSANKKQEYVKSDDKKEEKKVDEKKRDKDKYKQLLLAEDHAWMESSSDSDQEINANMVFMAQIEKVLSDSEASPSSSDNKIAEQTSSLKPYVLTVILKKIIIDLEDEVMSLLDNEKENLKIIDSLRSKDLDTLSSVRKPNPSGVLWKKKGSSNTVKTNLSSVNHSNLNKNVKRYSCKDLMLCNNSHLRDTRSAHDCNNAKILIVLLLSWDRISEVKDAFGNKQYKPEDIQELIGKLFNDVQNIHKELAEYINTPSWNHPAIYNYDDDDDDEDYTIAVTTVLSTKEPIDSLIIKDEHLDTISATKLDEDFSYSNDDSTSINDDYFSIDDIDYVEASPLDSELVSLEEGKDDILRVKLLNIHLLISKIESLNDNPNPDRLLKSPSPFPITVEDSDSFFEKSDTSLSYSNNSLPEFETFSNHTEETSSGNTTTHADYSFLEYDSFIFEIEPDQGELTSVVTEDI